MLDRIPLSLFYEWSDFAARHPFGEERADLRAGIIAAVVANVFSKSGRYKPSDFMPEFGKTEVKQSAKQMEAIMRTHVLAHNAALKAREQ